MQEKVEGKRRWLDEITEKLGLNLESTLKLAPNRNEWRKAVHEWSRHRLDSDDDDEQEILKAPATRIHNMKSVA